MASKGISPLISYILTILFSILFLGSIAALVFTFYQISLRNVLREGLRQVAVQTSDGVIRLYENSRVINTRPSNFTSLILGQIELELPAEISKRNYEVLLVSSNPLWSQLTNLTIGNSPIASITSAGGAKIIARSTQDPLVSVELDVPNFEPIVQGRSQNGIMATLKYFRYNLNGTTIDAIILGQSDIITKIDKVT